MSEADQDFAVALRLILRHPLVRAELRSIVTECQPQASNKPTEFIGTVEAARIGDVKAATVIAWIKEGRLPGTKPPGSREWRVRREDLEAFLTNRQHTGTQPVDLTARRLADLGRQTLRRGEK